MDWRSWIYGKLSTSVGILDHVHEDHIVSAGSLEGQVDKKPFVVISLDPAAPGPFPGSSSQGVVVWVHDDPGDYLRIEAVLKAVKATLVGQVSSQGAISCLWIGDSGDFADDQLGTITRNSTFMLYQTEES